MTGNRQGPMRIESLSAARIARLAAPVPRYTSYPTAPHFHQGVTDATYRGWLADLPDAANVSLYIHIPFCDTLCWFCGCSTKITRKYKPLTTYLAALEQEIATVAACLPKGAQVSHIHWGGGSPTMLSPEDITWLMGRLRAHFTIRPDAEFAVEVDPRGLDQARIDALAAAGLTRASIGVQDFAPKVQAAINRVQSVDETRAVIEAFRAHGITSLNIDAIYGLPGQYEPELLATLDAVVRMRPDRIALFGYAHVPWMKKHQELIPAADLPGVVERHAHAELAATFLTVHGYRRIGIDHFALPGDPLAKAARKGRLVRNFQGYTVDHADALIGLGASSIGRLPQGYVQNTTAIADYQRRVLESGTAVARGLALTDDDRMRGHVIERLMCDLAFDADALRAQYGVAGDGLIAEAGHLCQDDRDGLVRTTTTGFAVTERGRPFVRSIAARFDSYLSQGAARHSVAV